MKTTWLIKLFDGQSRCIDVNGPMPLKRDMDKLFEGTALNIGHVVAMDKI